MSDDLADRRMGAPNGKVDLVRDRVPVRAPGRRRELTGMGTRVCD
jgi:hypothetical protein